MPNASNAYIGKGTMEFKYQAKYKHVSALAPGGTVICVQSGAIAYNAAIYSMPGQPVAGSANPILEGEVTCNRTPADMLDGPPSVPLNVPISCDKDRTPIKAAARQGCDSN